MKLKLWQVDAFADRPFGGNPAAVVPLESWLDDAVLQAIANENNLAETAFLVRREAGLYDLRWFTPTVEVPLCGHATLASAWVIFAELAPKLPAVRFATQSGILTVERSADGRHSMAMPAGRVESLPAPEGFGRALGDALRVGPPSEIHFAPKGAGGTPAPIGVWPEAAIRAMRYSGSLANVLSEAGAGALLATAQGNSAPYDFVSRFFAPGMGVPEDPVTGSTHCGLIPYWAKRLGKANLRARQVSPRTGDLFCAFRPLPGGDRVHIGGNAVTYLEGTITI